MKDLKENNTGTKLVNIGIERLKKIKKLSIDFSKKEEKRFSANDIIVKALDEFIEKYSNIK